MPDRRWREPSRSLPRWTSPPSPSADSPTSGPSSSIQTGVAVANAAGSSTNVTFELTDLNGTPTGLTGSTSVPGNGQIALFLNQIEGFESLMLPFRGVLRISTGSSSGVSVVSLRGRYNERTDFLITTTPPSNEADTASTSEFLFPHLVDSGGYTTQFVLFSGTGLTSAGTVSFHEQSGGSLGLRLN